MAKEFKITSLRLADLEKELNYLKTTREREVAAMIAEARSSGCEPFLRSEKPPQGTRSLQSVSNSRTIRLHPTAGSGRTIGPGMLSEVTPDISSSPCPSRAWRRSP